MHQRQSKQTKILAPDPGGVDRGLYEDLLHRIGGDFSTSKQLRLMRLNLNIPNDSVAVCLRSPSATVVTRRCGARRAARAAGNLRPQLPTAQQDKTAGRSELPHHPLRYQQECSGSIYRKIDTHNLWPLSSLFRAPGSSISRSHQRNTLPVRLWPGGCSFQFGRTSILLPRPPHLAQTTRVRNHGTSVSAG